MTPTAGRRLKVVLAAVVVSLAAAAVAVWFVVLRDDAPPPATLVERATEPVAASSPDLSGPWELVPGKEVWAGYRITEHLGAIDNVAVARTGQVSAHLTIDGARITAVDAEVEMGTLASQDTELPGVGRRTDAMRTKGLETDRYPTATFTLTRPIDLGDLPAVGTTISARAVGTLDLHGVERGVSIPISARWSGKVMDLSGSVQLRLADYAIDPPDPKIVTVADTGTLELQLTFARR